MQGNGQFFGILRVNEQGSITDDFGQATDIADHSWRPACHRLKWRQTEAFVMGRMHVTSCPDVELMQILIRYATEEKNTIFQSE